MATQPYADATTAYEARDAAREDASAGYPDVGAQIFLWIAWTLAFATWAFFMSVDVGIVRAVAETPRDALRGGGDAGGVGFLLFTVLGVVALGIALLFGATRWATRDRSRDAMTEASTAALYDSMERAGGGGRRREEGEPFRTA